MERTIEERATMYGLSVTKHLSDSLRPQAVQRMHDIYKAIATEQKQIDIEKAKQAFTKVCGWMKTTQSWFDAVFDEFIKELEKTE